MSGKYRNILLVGVLFFAPGVIAPAQTKINFSNPITYPAGPNPGQVVKGDFNGDGKLDIAVLSQAVAPSSTGTVAILLGNGDGTFQSTRLLTIPSFPEFIAAADLDGDHKLDLIVVTAGDSSANSPAAVLLLRGDGDGGFQDPEDLHLEFVGAPLVVGDFNGDGIPDLVVATLGSSGTILVSMLGSGNAHFTPVDNYGADGLTTLIAVDVNGDQQLDLVVGTFEPIGSENSSGATSILLGKGDGRFQNPVVVGPGPVADLLGGDFAQNRQTDIVVGYSKSRIFGPGASVGLLVNDGKGNFTPGFSVSNSVDPGVGDFESNGKLDLAVVPVTSNPRTQLELFLGNGDHTFQAPITINVPEYESAFVNDLNADGVADLVLEGNRGLTVLLNQTPSFTFATDSQMDATVNPGDIASFTLRPVAHNGFDGMVSVSCSSSAPKSVSCSVSPTTVSPGQSFMVEVSATPTTTAAAGPAAYRFLGVCLLVPGLLIGVADRRARRNVACPLLLGLMSLLLLLASCGGGSSSGMNNVASSGTPAGTYAITVSGSSGASVSQARLALMVQ